jgi:phosphohistidine phosphatase
VPAELTRMCVFIRLTTVRHLHLLRHAKSSWDEPGLADYDRPLAPRGRRACKKLAKHLRREGIQPDTVLCSSSRRTRETLELIRSALEDPVIEIEDGLYAADSDRLLARVRELPETARSVLLIGHNPGLHELALTLAPGSAGFAEKFPTGALASLALDTPWPDIGAARAELVAYVVPRELA